MPSDEVIPRVGQVGTVLTAKMEEPNPNFDPNQPEGPGNLKYLPMNLNDDSGNSKLEMMRPNKKRFTLPAVVFGATEDGLLRHTDDTGIFNMSGIWRFRGIYNTSSGQNFPGSWFEQQIGK